MKPIHTVLIFFFLALQISITASTNVPAGNVSGTWTAANSPYIVQGEIKVPVSNTLTIEPGVVVEFAGHYKFIIEGRLVANGNSSTHITFTAQVPATGWYGLRFQDMNVNPMDTSYLSYCDLLYGYANGAGNDAYGGGVYCENSSRIKLSDCTISNCTATWGAGMYCNSSSPKVFSTTFYLNNDDGIFLNSSALPVISGCTFLENDAYGLRINGTTSCPVVTGCLFQQNTGYPVYAYPDQVGGFSGNTFQDNTYQLFYVNGGNISRDAIWSDPGIPYKIAGDMTVQGTYGTNGITTLTLLAGAVLKFSAQCGLVIGSNNEESFKGGLLAIGNAGDSVVFTGETATPGFWDGLFILNHAVDSLVKLNYCVVSYGGYGSEDNVRIDNCSPEIRYSSFRWGSGHGLYIFYSSPLIYDCEISYNSTNGIYSYNSATTLRKTVVSYNSNYGIYSAYANITIDSCMIKSNSSFGFYDLGGTDYPVVTNDTFAFNLSNPVNIHCNALNGFSGNVYTGNTVQRIKVGTGTILQDAAWTNPGIPYEISGDVIIAGSHGADGVTTLTLQPGTILRFVALSGISVGSGTTPGGLIAQGSAESRVLFTANSDTPTPGFWDGLTFNNASNDNICRLKYATVEYAGNSTFDGINMVSASPLIENSSVQMNNGAGLGCSSASNPIIRNTVFRDNTIYGIYVSASSPVVSNNTFDNQPNGLYCTGASNPQVLNNIFYSNSKGISSVPALSNVTYNDFYLNTTNFDGTPPSGFGTLSATNYNGTASDIYMNIFQDPGFVDAAGHNFNLSSGSACMNAGNPSTDTVGNLYCHWGNPRFLEDHVDIGAAEGGIWWTGAVSSNWHDAGNWSSGSVPLQSQSVTITPLSTQGPTLTQSNAIVNKLFLKEGTGVTVPNGFELQVMGN
jgi:parallel beta-helix repeat protein